MTQQNLQMMRSCLAVLVALTLLFSCGQVGEITGGEEDVTAPRVISNKVNPPMGSTNISPKKIILPFDEYIELNKPAENIRVSPSDVKLDYQIKNKSLVLSVKSGEWQPNTTYTIYLNRAVRDITEKNDSIMSYVFSTGSFLDSLQTAVQIVDAYTGKPSPDITVGLYQSELLDDTSKVSPRYYASTNKEGIAVFKNIKNEPFFVYAFDDKNRNNSLDATESRATLRKPVTLHVEDTVEIAVPIIRLMPPEDNTLKIVSNDFIPTATWCLGFNRPLNENENFVLITKPHTTIWNKEKDSLTVFFETTSSPGTVSGVLLTENKSDTLIKRYFFKEKPQLNLKSNLSDKKLSPSDTLKLTSNEPIKSIDTTLIKMQEIQFKDSLKRPLEFTIIPLSDLDIGFVFDKSTAEKVFLDIQKSGVSGINHTLKDSLNLEFSLQKATETGTMIIAFDSITPPYGILFIKNKRTKEIHKVFFDGIEKTTHRIPYLQPGQYDFYYLIDEDKNGRWSTGSIFEEKDAEKIIWLETVSTIRANWEVKPVLILNQ